MKKTRKQNLSKQIIYIIILLMLCNFILPNYVYAVDDDDGGDLFVDLAQLFCFIPDTIIEALQYMFVSEAGIKTEDGVYSIKYSPATIFSGEIPAFDINFISRSQGSTDVVVKYDGYVKEVLDGNYENATSEDSTNYINAQEQLNAFSVGSSITLNINNSEEADNDGYAANPEAESSTFTGNTSTEVTSAYYWVDEENGKLIIECQYPKVTGGSNYLGGAFGHVYFSTSVPLEDIVDRREEVARYSSTAAKLQGTISTWYNALSRIALVGLLSVLVYIGIRIVFSSTSAQDKAKYKNMLKDWLVAFCILFTLHYIMSITVTVVENVTEIIKETAIGPNGEDVLMSTIRNDIANADDWGQAIVQVFLYCVLSVFTIIFTIQYLRRVIYIGFLTVIAPLITLTYPLDKIKDSKSQAFDMWIKDYVFFSLLQVIHVLIYYILVGSSIDLAEEGNWLFAIVAIGFITQAEKIVKKMFGFEKSKTMGALAAGATGALVMNTINKISHKPSKNAGGKGGEKNNNNIRTATQDPIDKLKEKGADVNTLPVGANPITQNNEKSAKEKLKGGAKSLVGKYSRPIAEGVISTVSAGAFGMMGAASALIDGDIDGMITGAMTGAATGKSIAKRGINAVSNMKNKKNPINGMVDAFNEGALGEEAAQNIKFDREFRKSKGYKQLKENLGDRFSDDDVQSMLDAGITDAKDMEKIINNTGTGTLDDAMGFYALSQLCKDDVYHDDQKLRKWLDDKGFEQADVQAMKERMKNFRN